MDAWAAEDQAWLKVLEVSTLCALPMALRAAIELKVMDILADHHQRQQAAAEVAAAAGGSGAAHVDHHYLSAAQIVSRFEEHSPILGPNSATEAAAASSTSLDRILRLLASHGFLASSLQNHTRTYALNPLSHSFLRTTSSKDQASLAPFVLLMNDPILTPCLYSLSDVVLHGGVPFIKAHGMPFFSYIQKDPRLDQVFNLAMDRHTKLFMKALLETYNGFEGINTVVDVGGGVGASLGMVTSKCPHISGINFDLPHVIELAPNCPGVLHVGGDMFKKIPKGDGIFMKWILHDWSDEECIKILKKCYEALRTDGKVIVADAILPLQVESEIGARA